MAGEEDPIENGGRIVGKMQCRDTAKAAWLESVRCRGKGTSRCMPTWSSDDHGEESKNTPWKQRRCLIGLLAVNYTMSNLEKEDNLT